jgi:hypothetical protein
MAIPDSLHEKRVELVAWQHNYAIGNQIMMAARNWHNQQSHHYDPVMKNQHWKTVSGVACSSQLIALIRGGSIPSLLTTLAPR